MNTATIAALTTSIVSIIGAVTAAIVAIRGNKKTANRVTALESNGTSNVGASPNVGGDNGGSVFPNAGTD